MLCPACTGKYSRPSKTFRDAPDSFLRFRDCKHCGHRWWTIEVLAPKDAIQWMARDQPVRRPNYQRIRFSNNESNSGASNRWRRGPNRIYGEGL